MAVFNRSALSSQTVACPPFPPCGRPFFAHRALCCAPSTSSSSGLMRVSKHFCVYRDGIKNLCISLCLTRICFALLISLLHYSCVASLPASWRLYARLRRTRRALGAVAEPYPPACSVEVQQQQQQGCQHRDCSTLALTLTLFTTRVLLSPQYQENYSFSTLSRSV